VLCAAAATPTVLLNAAFRRLALKAKSDSTCKSTHTDGAEKAHSFVGANTKQPHARSLSAVSLCIQTILSNGLYPLRMLCSGLNSYRQQHTEPRPHWIEPGVCIISSAQSSAFPHRHPCSTRENARGRLHSMPHGAQGY
jgi:hypothetical protein